MENLLLQIERCGSVAKPSSDARVVGLRQIQDITDRRNLVALLSSDGHLFLVANGSEVLWSVPLNDVCDSSQRWYEIFNSDSQIICLSREGAIVSIDINTSEPELVGELDQGIFGAAWDISDGVLLVATFVLDEDDPSEGKKSVLLTLSTEWQVLAEVDLDGNFDEGHPVHVSFHPTRAQCAISSVDDVDSIRKVRIYNSRTLDMEAIGRTEDGSGKLAPNLDACNLSWAGSGCSNLLTTIQKKGKKTKLVAFFEPNGLRHGQFPLRSNAEVLAVQWNKTSDVLGIVTRLENDPKSDVVQLWHRRNYHWYLKQEVQLLGSFYCLAFSQTRPHTLLVSSQDESLSLQWRELRYQWHTSSVSKCDASVAYVVDGCQLHLTPLGEAIIPPPMCAETLLLDAPINLLALGWDRIDCVSLHCTGAFAVMFRQNKSTDRWTEPLSSNLFKADTALKRLRHLVIVDIKDHGVEMAGVALNVQEGRDELLVFKMVLAGEKITAVSIEKRFFVDGGSVLALSSWQDDCKGAIVELDGGDLFEVDFCAEELQLVPSPSAQLLEPCESIVAFKEPQHTGQGSSAEHARIVIGLSERGRLCCHDIVVTDCASSFVVSRSHEYLVYVTSESRCQIRFVHLSTLANLDPFAGSDENYELLRGYEPRDVERGAKVICVSKKKPFAIMQMPRGNLEAIYPRGLVLQNIISSIQSRSNYGDLLTMMRKLKVDLNLIVDVDPAYFLSNGVELLAHQVQLVDHINLFVSSLQNEDTTVGKNVIPSWKQAVESVASGFDFSSKVNRVCQRLRQVLVGERDRLGGNRFVLPILSTFAKEEPPKLEEALTYIKTLEDVDSALNEPPLFSSQAQDAIKYLAFMADYEHLFDTALGMYDFPTARAVAKYSQMDPKVYLALLRRYRSLPKYYGQYEVDVKLLRHECALRNLVKSFEVAETCTDPATEEVLSNSFDDCLGLIEKYELHKLALELFSDRKLCHRILQSLGDSLSRDRKYELALSVFMSIDPVDTARAMAAARACGDWRAYFSLREENRNAELEAFHAKSIADEFVQKAESSFDKRKLYHTAAQIALDYASDAGMAVECLMQAKMWDECYRVATMNSLPTGRCVEAAVAFAHDTIGDLEERSNIFKVKAARFDVIVQLRKQAIEAGEAEHFDEVAMTTVNDTDSLFSTTSTTASNASARSVSSVGSLSSVISAKSTSSFTLTGSEMDDRYGKNKRKKKKGDKSKRKRDKGKSSKIRPGSHAELLDVVQTLKVNVVDDGYRDLISETLTFLVRYRKMALAQSVYATFVGFQKLVITLRDERIESTRKTMLQYESQIQREGAHIQPPMVLTSEKEVNTFQCAELPESVVNLCNLLPSSF